MSFIIYPAIDIRGGKCVRLIQGDYAKETIYGEDPVEVARAWAQAGAEWIHLVDLDGAREGRPINDELVGDIARAVDIPVQIGGGIREIEHVKRLFSLGVSRIILGTAAVEDRPFVEAVLGEYGDRTAIGIDARDGKVATHGWLETTEVTAEELAKELVAKGAQTFICTDIAKDGMMSGPNVEAIVAVARASGAGVIASGGVSTYEDLDRLSAHEKDGVIGAIIGKALYTKAIDLGEALLRQKRGSGA